MTPLKSNTLKIAYISNAVIPSRTANSLHVMKMCQALSQNGHTAYLIVSDQSNAGNKNDIWQQYGISQKFDLIRIKTGPFIFNAIYQAVKRKADLIYTRAIDVAALSSILAIPTIYEAHGIPGGNWGPRYFKAFLMGKGFSQLVVISNALLKLLQQFDPLVAKKTNKIRVAHDGVDMERFKNFPEPEYSRAKLGIVPNRFTVGYTGHLYRGRGLNMIFKLARELEHINFLVVGGTENDFRQRISEVRKEGITNMYLTGYIPNSELPLFQAACDTLIMPYQKKVRVSGGKGDTSAYMSPLKMFEYMASGRLIISSNHEVLQEVLDNSNAILCDPEKINDWKTAILKAERHPQWKRKIGKRAQQLVQEYTWKNRVRRILGGTLRCNLPKK